MLRRRTTTKSKQSTDWSNAKSGDLLLFGVIPGTADTGLYYAKLSDSILNDKNIIKVGVIVNVDNYLIVLPRIDLSKLEFRGKAWGSNGRIKNVGFSPDYNVNNIVHATILPAAKEIAAYSNLQDFDKNSAGIYTNNFSAIPFMGTNVDRGWWDLPNMDEMSYVVIDALLNETVFYNLKAISADNGGWYQQLVFGSERNNIIWSSDQCQLDLAFIYGCSIDNGGFQDVLPRAEKLVAIALPILRLDYQGLPISMG